MIAYVYDAHGKEWTSLREAIPFVSQLCKVETARRRRTDITIECLDRLLAMGYRMPPSYVPPWLRNGRRPVLREPRRGREDRILAFYDSWDWKRLRYAHLRDNQRSCVCCGSTSNLHVDHIKPIRRHWELRLDPSNLQTLCRECNHGKGSWDETDWRPA